MLGVLLLGLLFFLSESELSYEIFGKPDYVIKAQEDRARLNEILFDYQEQNTSLIILHVRSTAFNTLRNKISTPQDINRYDLPANPLIKAYKANNRTHQVNNIAMYSKLKLGFTP